MTASLWLRMWPAVTIAILLCTELSWPFDVVRRWLQRSPQLWVNDDGTLWQIRQSGRVLGEYGSRKEAASHLKESDRVKGWLQDLTSCPWCIGAHLAYGLLGLVAIANGDWGLMLWWPALWVSASGTAVVLDAIAES